MKKKKSLMKLNRKKNNNLKHIFLKYYEKLSNYASFQYACLEKQSVDYVIKK